MKKPANQVQLVGNLGAVPELRTTEGNVPYITFSLAENAGNKLNKETKKKEPKTRWHDCIAWGEQLTNLLKDLRKGEKLLVQGVLDYDTIELEGRNRKFSKIVVHDFLYMEPKTT